MTLYLACLPKEYCHDEQNIAWTIIGGWADGPTLRVMSDNIRSDSVEGLLLSS